MRWALLARLVARGAPAPRQPGWEVRVPDKIELATGASGTVAVSIAVDRGLSVSRDADVILDVVPDPGLTVRKKRLGRRDAVDPEADAPRFAIPVRADADGEHTVKLRVRFWVCGGKVCKPIDVRRTATVAVTAPAPAPPDAGVD
ncbi:MAG: hypothetical protein JNL83_20785 [Myxococcales bacterium]|nr:hypothetical protein [Myxococcales bacterium]